MGTRPPINILGAKNYTLRTWWWRLASDWELVCWLWHCAATAVALKKHERVNAFNLVSFFFSAPNLRGRSVDRHHSLTSIRWWPEFVNWVRNLGSPLQQFGGPKHNNCGQISDNVRTWSRISPARNKMSSNGKRQLCYKLQSLLWKHTKFGELWSTNDEI